MRQRRRSSSKDQQSETADLAGARSIGERSDDERSRQEGRRGPNHNDHHGPDADPVHQPVCSSSSSSSSSRRGRLLLARWIICLICFHLLPLGLLAAGMALCFVRLYTAGECEMTYSRRTFFEIPVVKKSDAESSSSSSSSSSPSKNTYRLWKFVDARDPRGQQNRHDFCRPNVETVLYVPGHYGSYEQSRSLGAHGTQLTGQFGGTAWERRIVRLLAATMLMTKDNDTTSTTTTTTLDSFFYDVYAVDFNQEGSAFHGAILQRQADFIAAAIETLTSTCGGGGGGRVYIVAHSFGGISARLAVLDDDNNDGRQQQQQQQRVVRDKIAVIITLATPHAFPVWTWEPQVYNIYRAIAASRSSVPIISICGDFRDEMIPPNACDATISAGGGAHRRQQQPQTMSIHASDITNCSLGMDHRAIVWCHNLLAQVRSLLYVLEMEQRGTTSAPTKKPDPIAAAAAWFQSNHGWNASQYDYLDRTRAVQAKLTSTASSDFWTISRGLLMELGLLHNMPLLIDLFATNGALRHGFPAVPPAITVAVTILTHYLWSAATASNSSISFTVLAILTLTANTVYSLLYWLLTSWSQSSVWCQFYLHRRQRHLILMVAGGVSLVGGFFAVVGFTNHYTAATTTTTSPSYSYADVERAVATVATVASSLFGALAATLLLVVVQRRFGPEESSLSSRQTLHFAAWLLPLLVPMVMGDCWLAIMDGRLLQSSSSSLSSSSWTVPWIMVLISVRLLLFRGHDDKDPSPPRPMDHLPHGSPRRRVPQLLLRIVVVVVGVWDHLSARQDRNRKRFMPIYASLLLSAACLDLVLSFGGGRGLLVQDSCKSRS